MCFECFPARGDRFRGDERKRDYARLLALVLHRATLDEHVARLKVRGVDVEHHVDLAGDNDGIVDRVGAVIARCDAWIEFDHPKDGPIVDRRTNTFVRGVVVVIVVNRKIFAQPDIAPCRTRAVCNHVPDLLVDQDATTPGGIVALRRSRPYTLVSGIELQCSAAALPVTP
jgi:hypothetical protein